MEGTALLVIALRGREVETFAGRDVMREEVTCDRFLRSCAAVISRNHIHDSGGIIDAHDEWLDTFQGRRAASAPPRTRLHTPIPAAATHNDNLALRRLCSTRSASHDSASRKYSASSVSAFTENSAGSKPFRSQPAPARMVMSSRAVMRVPAG